MTRFALWGARRRDVQVGGRADVRLQARLRRDTERWQKTASATESYYLAILVHGAGSAEASRAKGEAVAALLAFVQGRTVFA
jgi:hypothetical protein